MGVVERPGVTRDVPCSRTWVAYGKRGRQTMERRKFIIGAGALATGSAAAVGTGAFSSAQLDDRTVNVNVAGDANSFIQLNPTSQFAGYDDNETLELDFTELESSVFGDEEGINPQSTYVFEEVFEMVKIGTGEDHDYNFKIEPDGFDVDIELTSAGSAEGNAGPSEGTDLTEPWGFGGQPTSVFVDITIHATESPDEQGTGGTLTIIADDPDEI